MISLHTEGARKYRGKRQHRWETWREFHTWGEERDYGDFLHLIDSHRVKIHMKILKYFFFQTSFNGETEAVMETVEVTLLEMRGHGRMTPVRRQGETQTWLQTVTRK